MKITKEFTLAFLAKIGISNVTNVGIPNYGLQSNDILFKTSEGETDSRQADLFQIWLDKHNYQYKRESGHVHFHTGNLIPHAFFYNIQPEAMDHIELLLAQTKFEIKQEKNSRKLAKINKKLETMTNPIKSDVTKMTDLQLAFAATQASFELARDREKAINLLHIIGQEILSRQSTT